MKHHIIIGISAAGLAAAKRLRKLAPNDRITCIAGQSEPPFNTCLLADFVSESEVPEGLYRQSIEFFDANNITLHLDTLITEVHPSEKEIHSASGDVFSYDTLLIATGTTPRKLPLDGATATNCFGFHVLHDALTLDEYIKKHQPQKAIVIGAGLSGVECADALYERNLNVTIIEQSNRILPTLIDVKGSRVIEQALKMHNVSLNTNTSVTQLHTHQDRITAVTLSDGETIETDLIIAAIGATPATQCVANTAITLRHGGILVNEYLESSVSDIYAAGDVATVVDQISGGHKKSCTWPDAIKQGMMAAQAMAGQPKEYPGVSVVLSSNFFGIQFVSCGPVVNTPEDYTVYTNDDGEHYHKYLRLHNKLVGFLQVGELDNIGALRASVTKKQELSEEEWQSFIAS